MISDILHIAAFCDGTHGGNPAGVWIGNLFPDETTMQRLAYEVGYSETVFAIPDDHGWRVRYFSPESEVPFCGHATIALGAALALKHDAGVFRLTLNNARISVEGTKQDSLIVASFQSPQTHSEPVDTLLLNTALALFNLNHADMEPAIPPAIIFGGAKHLLLALKEHKTLKNMRYELSAGKVLMNKYGLATIILTYAESNQVFHARNPFASGGVYEDPATGAATAALAGYLRNIEWPHNGTIDVIQGEDMGCRCRLQAAIGPEPGSSIRVSGTARLI